MMENTQELERLRKIEKTAKKDIKKNHHGYENCEITNVIHYNKEVELVNRKNGKKEKFDLCVAWAQDPETKEIWEMYYLDGKEVDFTELMRDYESATPIKDVIDMTNENEEKPEKEQDKELVKVELNELKLEKEVNDNEDKEQKEEEKDEEKQEDKKPSHIIERINPDKAKMDYWKNIRQAFGLPSEVSTLAFAYPEASTDKVDSANITVYMLDKDGNIINDLDVNDYFEFDTSTGNNPMNDDVVRHEEDENKGKTQIEENRTMIRLKAKNAGDNNTYISLEQKNGLGDYNDINAGRKTVAGTQNVEKQLETDRLRIWDSDRERLFKSNAGIYNMNEIFDEAQKHKAHGDDGYIDKENADGEENTIAICDSIYVPDTHITWEEFSKSMGEKDVKDIVKEFFERYDGRNGQELLLLMQKEYQEENENKQDENEKEEGFGPWDRDNMGERVPWRH